VPELTSMKSYVNTKVPAARTQEQIERLLRRIDVDATRWTTYGLTITLEFAWTPKDRPGRLGFLLRLNPPEERERPRHLRALYWYLKAKIEAYEFGLVDLAQEFLPHLLTGPNITLYEEAQPRIEQRMLGQDLPLLPEAAGGA